jgi:WD40 repeat protein
VRDDSSSIAGGEVIEWEVESGRMLWRSALPESFAKALAFSEASSRLVLARSDGIVQIFEAQNGVEVAALRGTFGNLTAMSASPDGHSIVISDARGGVERWNLAESSHWIVSNVGSPVVALAHAPGGNVIYSLSSDGALRTWEGGAVTSVSTMEIGQASIRTAALSSTVSCAALFCDGDRQCSLFRD